jgi:signal transduction histidine kinase
VIAWRGRTGIAARIALVAIAGLIGAQLLSVVVALALRPAEVRVYAVNWLADRGGEIARGAFARPPLERDAFLAGRPEQEFLHLVWLRQWHGSDDTMRRARPGRLARAVAERLPEGFAVFTEYRRAGPMRPPRFGEGQVTRIPREDPGLGDGAFEGVVPGTFTIAIRGPDGTFVVIRPQEPLQGWAWGILAGWLVGIAAAAAIAAWWAARRIARPLEILAADAGRAGAGRMPDFAVPDPAPREVRTIARALGEMHARLRGFVDDRTRMVAAMSHDLRTPLTRLRLRAEQIPDAEERAKAAADIDEMERMIAETLDFARADALEAATERFDLAALVQSQVDDLSDLGADIVYAGPAALAIEGRPRALRRAIGNLIDNALGYGGRARVHLRSEAGAALLAIEDDGPGIPAAQFEAVFAPFHRLDASRSRRTGGVGLGLAVARDVARAHGGDIVLANLPGRGLRATLTLPRAD